jgi:hypothetical protein
MSRWHLDIIKRQKKLKKSKEQTDNSMKELATLIHRNILCLEMKVRAFHVLNVPKQKAQFRGIIVSRKP